MAGRLTSVKNSNDNIGNRTCDFMARSAVPQPTAPRRIIVLYITLYVNMFRRQVHQRPKGKFLPHFVPAVISTLQIIPADSMQYLCGI
jgi:hypothetical protein